MGSTITRVRLNGFVSVDGKTYRVFDREDGSYAVYVRYQGYDRWGGPTTLRERHVYSNGPTGKRVIAKALHDAALMATVNKIGD